MLGLPGRGRVPLVELFGRGRALVLGGPPVGVRVGEVEALGQGEGKGNNGRRRVRLGVYAWVAFRDGKGPVAGLGRGVGRLETARSRRAYSPKWGLVLAALPTQASGRRTPSRCTDHRPSNLIGYLYVRSS